MPRALQDRGICGLIAVQPALVVQHEWPEDEAELTVVRASRVLSQRCGMHGAHGMRDIEAQMACMAQKWHGWHGWQAWHAWHGWHAWHACHSQTVEHANCSPVMAE